MLEATSCLLWCAAQHPLMDGWSDEDLPQAAKPLQPPAAGGIERAETRSRARKASGVVLFSPFCIFVLFCLVPLLRNMSIAVVPSVPGVTMQVALRFSFDRFAGGAAKTRPVCFTDGCDLPRKNGKGKFCEGHTTVNQAIYWRAKRDGQVLPSLP